MERASIASQRIRLALVLPIVGGILTLLTACGRDAPATPPGPRPVAVNVVHVTPKTLPVSIDGIGRTEGSLEVEIRARVSGILAKQTYEEGSVVAAGAQLFLVDPEPFEVALTRARATLAQERARAEQARRDATRADDLLKKALISRKEFEDVQTGLNTAEAALLAAQAQVREAELDLSYTRVTTPIAGTTGRALKSVGSLAIAGTESALLTTVVRTDPIWVRLALSETEFNRLRSALLGKDAPPVAATLNVRGSETTLHGHLNFTGSSIDSRLGTVEIRAEFPNPALTVLPGQYVTVSLETPGGPTITVARTAVLDGREGKFVWIVGPDGKATQRNVVAGRWVGNEWEILEGLAPGDAVIVDNLLRLRPGSPLEIQDGAPGDGEADAQRAGAADSAGPAGRSATLR